MIAYCPIYECEDWECPKKETCKRNIPRQEDKLFMNAFYVCKTTNCSLYIKSDRKEGEQCS